MYPFVTERFNNILSKMLCKYDITILITLINENNLNSNPSMHSIVYIALNF